MQELFNRINCANGEIRTMAARYEGPGWYCLLTLVEQPDEFWERWEDLVCGDNDFFEARQYFKEKKEVYGDFVLVVDTMPTTALDSAIKEACKLLEKEG